MYYARHVISYIIIVGDPMRVMIAPSIEYSIPPPPGLYTELSTCCFMFYPPSWLLYLVILSWMPLFTPPLEAMMGSCMIYLIFLSFFLYLCHSILYLLCSTPRDISIVPHYDIYVVFYSFFLHRKLYPFSLLVVSCGSYYVFTPFGLLSCTPHTGGVDGVLSDV